MPTKSRSRKRGCSSCRTSRQRYAYVPLLTQGDLEELIVKHDLNARLSELEDLVSEADEREKHAYTPESAELKDVWRPDLGITTAIHARVAADQASRIPALEQELAEVRRLAHAVARLERRIVCPHQGDRGRGAAGAAASRRRAHDARRGTPHDLHSSSTRSHSRTPTMSRRSKRCSTRSSLSLGLCNLVL